MMERERKKRNGNGETESVIIETNDLPTSQCWLTFNRPICRITTASEDSDEAV